MYKSYASYAGYVQKHSGNFIGFRDVMHVVLTASRSTVKDELHNKLRAMAAVVAALTGTRTALQPSEVKYAIGLNEEQTRASLYMLPRDAELHAVVVAELRVAEDVLQEWLHIRASTDVTEMLFKLAAEQL